MRSDITYSDSGVDIDKADEAVQKFKQSKLCNTSLPSTASSAEVTAASMGD